jgi:hypothetical protein
MVVVMVMVVVVVMVVMVVVAVSIIIPHLHDCHCHIKSFILFFQVASELEKTRHALNAAEERCGWCCQP